MKSKNTDNLIYKSAREQQILMNDERNIRINEKVAYSVSKIMSYIFIGLLFITGGFMKDFTCLFIISIVIIIKFILTMIYLRYYNKTI